MAVHLIDIAYLAGAFGSGRSVMAWAIRL
jgi:hypothetical protein